MFRVKWPRRWLISKSSFSRQCVGRIRDRCSQLTWKGHSPHTHGGTFWPTLTPAQTLYLHESCQNKPKFEVCKMATSPFDIRVASSSVVFMIHAASWHKTYTHTHRHKQTLVQWRPFLSLFPRISPFPFVAVLCILRGQTWDQPSYHVLLEHGNGMVESTQEGNGGKVRSMRGKWCTMFKAGCPSCHQPVLKTSTGPHPFFNHRQTPAGRDVDPFTSALQRQYPMFYTRRAEI